MKKLTCATIFVLTAFVLCSCAPAATPAPAAPAAPAPAEPAAPSANIIPQVEAAPAQAVEQATEPQFMDGSPLEHQPGKVTVVPLNNPSVPNEEYPEETAESVYDQGNEFQGYGVNDYENTRQDNLSTFAIDVDTASYSVARRYINDGSLPPAEAIRVEEFVNSFDSGYAAPQDSAFALYADGALSPFVNDGTYLIRFGVKGYEVPDFARKPVALTFVIDVSGSMSMENRLGLVKESLKLLVKRLNSEDSVAIIVYGTEARTVMEPTSGSQKPRILRAIDSLHTEGSTNAEAGLRLGYETAMQSFIPEASNRVILCSDGVANTGTTSADGILSFVQGYVDEGITMTSMAFGMGNFNDTLMEQLADKGNGNYYYIDTIDEARDLFVENLTSTLQIIARDAKIQIDFNPDVVSYYRLVGYENRDVADEDFRNDDVDAGEVGAGHSVTAIYAVHFNRNARGRIATIQMRWEDPDTYEVMEINGDLTTRGISHDFENTAPQYQLAVVAMQFAEVLRESPWGQDTDITLLGQYAAGLKSKLHDEDVTELTNLIRKVDRLHGNGWPW